MSGGGGKGGSKTTETTIPEWVRAPADRNLQRAEAVQQLEYMPYFGAQVAALNENQTNAMQNNANAASAFGLLAPTDVMADMPTPTTYANGMKGYSSMPIYDQAMKELTASNPENMDAYDALFGNRTTFGLTGGGGATSNSRFSGSANPNPSPSILPYNDPGEMPSGADRPAYVAAMDKTYANTKVGENMDGTARLGYTGQGNQSRAGIRATTPVPKATATPIITNVSTTPDRNNRITFAPVRQTGAAAGGTARNYGTSGRRITGGR